MDLDLLRRLAAGGHIAFGRFALDFLGERFSDVIVGKNVGFVVCRGNVEAPEESKN